MNLERSKFSEEKIDMPITIDIDSSKRSGISSQNLSLYLSDHSMPDDFSRPRSSLNYYYDYEKIVIANTLRKPKRLTDNIPYSSHIRLSNVTPEEKRRKVIASSDSELHKKVQSPKKRLPDLFPRRSAILNVSVDSTKNINSALKTSGRFRAENISSVDLIPPQPTNNRDMKIFWITIFLLIIYAYFSRFMYSFRQYN